MKLKNLFTPITIGGFEVKNRIVMAPMGANFENIDGSVNDALIDYFEARSRGGVGLIISPFTMVNADQRTASLSISSDRYIPGINRLCERVQSFGARFLLQIAHPGGKVMPALTGKRPVAPSSFKSPMYWEAPRELTREEIETLIEVFVQAARRAREAGCEGVEVHGAHTYLIGQFISPHANRREDEYGGDFEGRMRFPSKIVRGIKAVCGKDFIIGFKFSAHEELEGGVDENLARRIAEHMEKEGIHYIHVAATSSIPGLLEVVSDFPSDPSIYSPPGVLVKLAENVKEVVDIPVVGTGGISDPDYAESILREEKADLVAIGRALIADPEWPAKTGRGIEIRYCVKCNICHKRLWSKQRVKCTVNPAVGEERRFQMKKTSSPKKVIVLGAGPAGMEAALVASQRGHYVILYEEKERVGGKMVAASTPQFKPEIGKLLQHYERSLERSPVEVRLGQEISSVDPVFAENPDVIIPAVGADLALPEVPGIKQDKVLTVLQIFEDRELEIGRNILIIGAGLVGCETGWYLASRGKSVKLVDILSEDEILLDEHPTNRSMLLRSMKKEGVEILGQRVLRRIEDEGVIVENLNGPEESLPAENVVIATGFKPRNELKEALVKAAPDIQVFPVGDCKEVRKLYEAIHEGFHAAWQI